MARKAGIGALLPSGPGNEPEGDGASPVFQRLYRQLRAAVLEGRLRPGARLPATRFLARELGLSRNTVLTAYDQLASEGFLELRHRSGVFVAEDLPIAAPRRGPQRPPPRPPRLGMRGAAMRLSAGPIGAGPPRQRERWPGCFATGAAGCQPVPVRPVGAAAGAQRGGGRRRALPVGGDPGGHPDLRAAIAALSRRGARHRLRSGPRAGGERHPPGARPHLPPAARSRRPGVDGESRLSRHPRRARRQRRGGRGSAGRRGRDRRRGRPAHGGGQGAAGLRRALAPISRSASRCRCSGG